MKNIERIHKYIKESGINPEGHNSKRAKLYGVDMMGGSEPFVELIGENGDVYELLSDYSNAANCGEFTKFAITTCGWAAPLDDDETYDESVKPSEHPKRRRVMLVCMYDGGKLHSAIDFEDSDEYVYDDGGRGELANAIMQFAAISQAMRVVKKTMEGHNE